MSAFTIATAAQLLERHHLLREIIHTGGWTLDASDVPGADNPIAAVTYDTRTVAPGSMLFVKGRFRPEFWTASTGAAWPSTWRKTTTPTAPPPPD